MTTIMQKYPRTAWLAAIGGSIYVAICPRMIGRLIFRSALFNPNAGRVLLHDLHEHLPDCAEDWLKVGRQDVHVAFIKGSSCYPVFLYCVGRTGHTNVAYIRAMLATGASVLVVQYPGYGRSTGRPSISQTCNTGLVAWQYLVRDLEVPPSQIILYGESLGGGVAWHTWNKVECRWLVSQSTFSCLWRAAKDSTKWLSVVFPPFLYPGRLNNLKLARRCKMRQTQVWILHGDKDEMIPLRHAHQLVKAAGASAQLVVIPGVGHIDLYLSDRYTEIIASIADTVRAAHRA